MSSSLWMPRRIAAAKSLSVQIRTGWHGFEDMFRYRLQIQRLPYNYAIHLNYLRWDRVKWLCPFNKQFSQLTTIHWLEPIPHVCNETIQTIDDYLNHIQVMAKTCRFHKIVMEFYALIYQVDGFRDDIWMLYMKKLLDDGFDKGW